MSLNGLERASKADSDGIPALGVKIDDKFSLCSHTLIPTTVRSLLKCEKKSAVLCCSLHNTLSRFSFSLSLLSFLSHKIEQEGEERRHRRNFLHLEITSLWIKTHIRRELQFREENLIRVIFEFALQQDCVRYFSTEFSEWTSDWVRISYESIICLLRVNFWKTLHKEVKVW